MIKKILIIIIAAAIFCSTTSYAESKNKPFLSCTVVLEQTEDVSENTKGVALIYNIEREFNDKRTSLSVHALHMPKPSKFGDYDGYEVLAYIPNEISWTFKLTQYLEDDWAGKWEEISPTMRPTRIKVRPINSSTNKFGPVVLEGNVTCSN